MGLANEVNADAHERLHVKMIIDANGKLVPSSGEQVNAVKQETQQHIAKAIHTTPQEMLQNKVSLTFAAESKIIPTEHIREILEKPFLQSGCIDKDKKKSYLNVGGAGIGRKAAIIATLRKKTTMSTEQIHLLVTDLINELGGMQYHTDDKDITCLHDQDAVSNEHAKHIGCKHREYLQHYPNLYKLTREDAAYLEHVKYPIGPIKKIERYVIERKNMQPEKDFTVIITDYIDPSETEEGSDQFYHVPNTVEVDGDIYRCYDYSRKLAHHVIDKSIIPYLMAMIDQHNVGDTFIESHADLAMTLKDTLDAHNHMTINKATAGKPTIHLIHVIH